MAANTTLDWDKALVPGMPGAVLLPDPCAADNAEMERILTGVSASPRPGPYSFQRPACNAGDGPVCADFKTSCARCVNDSMATLDHKDTTHGSLDLTAQGQPVFLVARAGRSELIREKPREFHATLLESGGRWIVLVRMGGRRVSLNGIAVVAAKVLHHGDVLEVEGSKLLFSEETAETIAADSELLRKNRRCPRCKAFFKEGESVILCPRCRLAHHAAPCWRVGGCGSSPSCGYPRRGTVREAVPEAASDGVNG